MARPNSLGETMVVSVRMETDMYSMLQDLAALETINTGRVVTIQELVRGALQFTYSDNERVRESFRRSRSHVVGRGK